jgi:hypothetical protein
LRHADKLTTNWFYLIRRIVVSLFFLVSRFNFFLKSFLLLTSKRNNFGSFFNMYNEYFDLVKKEGSCSIKRHFKTVVVKEWYIDKTFWRVTKKLHGVEGLESKNKIFGLFVWREMYSPERSMINNVRANRTASTMIVVGITTGESWLIVNVNHSDVNYYKAGFDAKLNLV